MDISIPLIGVLGLIGYNLNKEPNSREYINKRVKIPVSELPNGKSIYESKEFVRAKREEQSRLDKFYKDENTIVDANRYKVNSNVPGARALVTIGTNQIPKVASDEVKYIDEFSKIYSGPMFKSDKFFNPVTEPSIAIKENFDPSISKLSGQKTDYSHSNMQPFFGSSVKASANSDAILERYTSKSKPHKIEKFANTPNGPQNTAGMAPYTSLIDETRFQPGMIRNNVLPFKQYQTAPIPPEYLRGEERTIEELRPLNKPKANGVEARINVGAGNYVRAQDPVYVKNKVNKFYKGDFNGIYPTGNTGKNASYQVNYEDDFRYTSKAETTETELNRNPGRRDIGNYISLTNDDINEDTYKLPSRRHNFANDWIRNAKNSIYKRNEDVQNTYNAPEQERETTNIENFGIGYFKSSGKVIQSIDKAKTTNKELTSYSYIPSAQSQVNKGSIGREFYNKINPKTKPTREYFPGGVKKFAPQTNNQHIAPKNKPIIERYEGIAKMNNIKSADVSNLGVQTHNRKFRTSEADFSYRIGN